MAGKDLFAPQSNSPKGRNLFAPSEAAAPVGKDLLNGPIESQQPPQWSDLPGNIIPSVKKLGGDVASFAAHPWDAAASVAEIGAGAISQFFPDVFENSTMQEAEDKAAMVGQAMKERYGGDSVEEVMANIKKTVVTDPAGFAADLGGLLSGGGALAAKTGIKGAQTVSRIGSFVDPVALAGKTAIKTAGLAKRAPKAITGLLSGMGEDVVGQLYKAGKEGGVAKETAVRHMRDAETAGPEILTMARSGMENLRKNRNEQYRSGMVDISNDATILDFKGINEKFMQVIEENTHLGVPKSKSKARALEEVALELEEWERLGPDYRTPEGLDALKQRIGDLVDWKNKDNASNRAYMGVYDAIKETIKQQAPIYAEIMKDYSDASVQILDLEKGLSMKASANPETALRTLSSSLRNNVNTNFGQRGRLVGELEQASGQPLKAAIAGQSASSLTPRGLQGLGMTGNITAGALSGFSPAQIPLLAAQSPRIVGETAVGMGSMARQLGRAVPNVNVPPMVKTLMRSPQIPAGVVQGGRLNDERFKMQKALGAN